MESIIGGMIGAGVILLLVAWYHRKTRCPCCGEMKSDVKRRHRNTSYVHKESNYLTACPDCQRKDDEYYAERWAEYYAGCL